jgi:hypothetical protein
MHPIAIAYALFMRLAPGAEVGTALPYYYTGYLCTAARAGFASAVRHAEFLMCGALTAVRAAVVPDAGTLVPDTLPQDDPDGLMQIPYFRLTQ